MSKIKITAVSYLNTLPFIYGMNHSEFLKKNCIIELDYPAKCAEKLIHHKVDIGLIPVASILQLQKSSIITDYCIGAYGKVKSVLLVSNKPLSEITKILLDYQSRTSIILVKILADKLWNISPAWCQAEIGYENSINGSIAGVIIGDRAISLQKNFKYIYDLSEEWFKLTKLPFVFACWVANKQVHDEIIQELNCAFEYGIKNISKIESNILSKDQLHDYLINNLSFHLDKIKTKCINTFFGYINELHLIPDSNNSY
jgi:chorismate dehydratase